MDQESMAEQARNDALAYEVSGMTLLLDSRISKAFANGDTELLGILIEEAIEAAL